LKHRVPRCVLPKGYHRGVAQLSNALNHVLPLNIAHAQVPKVSHAAHWCFGVAQVRGAGEEDLEELKERELRQFEEEKRKIMAEMARMEAEAEALADVEDDDLPPPPAPPPA
jgi:hypothetical protein